MGQAGDALGVTILHISDTQFGTYHRFDSSDSLSSNLIRDLSTLAKDGVPPIDLVVLSGDITERGKAREYAQALAFIDEVCVATGLDRDRVVIVPGNHDVSWPLSRSFFDEWSDAHDDDPPPPFFKKWRNYQDFAARLHGPSAFTEDQPYRLQRFDDLRVVVAAMNSTMRESHREADHYGWCGRDQLRWFADQLDAEDLRSTLKIGVLHHNARRKAEADNENLRDEDDLTAIIDGRLDLLLHGHTHEGKEDRLSDGTLVLATGSAAVTVDWRPDETPNQYQVLHIEPGSVVRWARCWDSRRRWMPDLRASRRGDELKVRIDLPVPGWQRNPLGEKAAAFSALWNDEQESFARRVEQVTRLDLGQEAEIDRRTKAGSSGARLQYLVAFRPSAPLRCIGIADGPASTELISDLEKRVFGPLRQHGAIELLVVHRGPDQPELRASARESGVRLKTWTEYNSLLETGAYRTWLLDQLDADRLYPQDLYQPQKYQDVDRFGGVSGSSSDDLLGEVYSGMLDEDSRFALVLGDAGFGKSFLVRRLAYRLLGNQSVGLTPIVVYLRDRDKRQTLDEMVSAAMLPSKAAFQPDRFQHSLHAGSLVLLIDGYDEFAVRVGYANAAAQLRTFTEALSGRAKLVLTTRPSHFRSTDHVTSKLFADLSNVHQGRVYLLEPFDTDQQRAFLTRWFERSAHVDPPQLADEWMRALACVDNLPELARTPRMLSFIVEDLTLADLRQAAGQGVVTAAKLYQRLVNRWLVGETDKIDPAAPGTISAAERQEVLEDLAVRLWQAGERDVTEDVMHQCAQTLNLPKLDLTLDQAAQEIGGRTFLQVDKHRWRFAHQSIWEFLLANRLAALLRSGQANDLIGQAELTSLTARFLRDLAPEEATAWLSRQASGR